MPKTRQASPIQIFNRYTGAVETEQVYGEKALRWAYETGLGRIALTLLVTRPWFSRWYGWRMSRPASRSKIPPFIEEYGLNAGSFAEAPERFPDFNAFFARKLKPEARPVDAAPDSLVFPADGRHFLIPDLEAPGGFFLKGRRFELASFLGDAAWEEEFRGGSLVISRLCPIDYHRFHFPASGEWTETRTRPGPLFSVNPLALHFRPSILWTNFRKLSRVCREGGPSFLIAEVGATMVGGIHDTAGQGPVEKGQEKGYFTFGGSSVVCVFPRGAVAYADDLQAQSAAGRELYAHVGDRMGSWR